MEDYKNIDNYSRLVCAATSPKTIEEVKKMRFNYHDFKGGDVWTFYLYLLENNFQIKAKEAKKYIDNNNISWNLESYEKSLIKFDEILNETQKQKNIIRNGGLLIMCFHMFGVEINIPLRKYTVNSLPKRMILTESLINEFPKMDKSDFFGTQMILYNFHFTFLGTYKKNTEKDYDIIKANYRLSKIEEK
jgi:hypothetical protein